MQGRDREAAQAYEKGIRLYEELGPRRDSFDTQLLREATESYRELMRKQKEGEAAE
jgi:hypothetical protein